MIHLTKGAPPQVLVDNAATWTAELVSLAGNDRQVTRNVRERYGHPDIKSAVSRDSRGKCIYCESKVQHVTHGDIEHIRPKSKFPELTFE